MRNLLARIAGRAVERPTPVIVAAVLVTLIGAVAALRLEADRSPDSLVNRGSGTYAATQKFYDSFGGEPVEVLVQGDLRQLLLTDNLGRLLALESCLSGKAPGGHVINGQPAPPACAAIARLDPSTVVFGPATFLNQFAIQAQKLLGQQAQGTLAQAQRAAQQAAIRARKSGLSAAAQRQAAAAAYQQTVIQFYGQLRNLAIQYGQTGIPRLNDPRFVSSVICDNRLPQCTPKARLSGIVPSSDAALISVRLRPALDDSQRREAISLFRQAVADPTFQLHKGASFDTQPSYVVSGVPVVFEGLAQELSTQIFILLAAARGGPVIATAGLATVAGFAVLVLSPIPMVRGFALLLVLGIVVAFVLALTVGLSALSLLTPRRLGTQPPGTASRARVRLAGVRAPVRHAFRPSSGLGAAFVRPRRAVARAGASLRQTGAALRSGGRAAGRRALAVSIAAPGRVLAVAALVAIVGWGVGTRIPVISDIRQLVPRDLPALQNVDHLEQATGISGITYVTVTAPDLND